MKRFRAILLLVVVMVLTVSMMVSCKKKEAPQEAYGEYYYNISEEAVNGFVLSKEGYTLKEISGDKTGGYKYDGKKEEFIFDALDGKTAMTGKYVGGSFTLKIGDNTYECKKGKIVKVSFNAEGSAGKSPMYVAEGSKLSKPVNPTSAGKIFAGWYTDRAFKTAYDFDSKVNAELVLYARFVNPVSETFTAVLIDNGNKYGEVTANRGGILENLPTPTQEGKTFLGWWLSDYQDATKLTRQYKAEVLTQNEILYSVYESDAPAVSVDQDGVEWGGKGISANYKVEVIRGGEVLKTQTTSSTSYEYDFKQQPAGEYQVKVTFNNKTATAYYRNKALARVCVFEVEGSVLKFNAIEGAEKYIVTVECGNPDHNHKGEVTTNSFDFSACDMRAEGIDFSVEAVADGYLSSHSKTFNFERHLENITGLNINKDTEQFVWDKLENATGYMVSINGGEYQPCVSETSKSVREYDGEITIKVYATAHGYNASQPVSYTYTKTRLASPRVSSFRLDGNNLVWDAVSGADSYTVTIGQDKYTTQTPSISLSGKETTADSVDVSIVAHKDGDATKDSLTSEVMKFAKTLKDGVTYEQNFVKWSAVFGITKYGVTVNDGAEQIVSNAYSLKIDLTKKGQNSVKVRFYDADDAASDWEEIFVTAYEVKLMANDNTASVYKTLYRAVGDYIGTDGNANRPGYQFRYWSAETEGPEYQKIVLDAAADVVLYAQWTAKSYTVTFDAGETGEVVGGADSCVVQFDSNYKLPVAKDPANVKIFAGWFKEPNGGGAKLADQFGDGIGNWGIPNDLKVYAHFVDVFEFNPILGGTAYTLTRVKTTISLVKDLTIPDKYNGLPVLEIDGGAFINAPLKVLRIPDTVQYIEWGTNGAYNTGSAFNGCRNIVEFDVYYVRGNHERAYASALGAMYKNNIEGERGVELKCLPYQIEEYVMPETINVKIGEDENGDVFEYWKVNVLGRNCTQSTVKRLTIASTVTRVERRAIYASYKLEVVTFATENHVDGTNLMLEDEAFAGAYYSSGGVREINLPSWTSEISSNKFYRCEKLERVNIVGKTVNYTSVDGMVCNATGDTIALALKGLTGNYVIPTQISKIGPHAFENCVKLAKVTFPGYVTEIGAYAFAGCTDASFEVEFTGEANDPKLTIREKAFYGCTYLKQVVLAPNVQAIEINAFGGNSLLKTVTVNSNGQKAEGQDVPTLNFDNYAFADVRIPNMPYNFSVTALTIGADVPAFDLVNVFGDNLTTFVIDANNQNYSAEDNVIYDKAKTRIIFYPKTKTGEYVIPDTVLEIADNTFANRVFLTKVTVGKNVQKIGASAFENCHALTEVVFADQSVLTSIGNYAFRGCQQLQTVTLPAKLTTLGAENQDMLVFDGCGQLKTINIAEGNTSFAQENGILYALDADGNKAELICVAAIEQDAVLDLPATLTKISARAFAKNTRVKEVVFTNGITTSLTISDQAFKDCVNLQKISLPKNLASIGAEAFAGCAKLTAIAIPETVTFVGGRAFADCKTLATVTFDAATDLATAKDIGFDEKTGNVFENTAITEISLPERMKKLTSYLFAGCDTLVTANIPDSVIVTGSYVFTRATAAAKYTGNLMYLNFGENSKLETIAQHAFRALNKLTKINLPTSVKSIGLYAYAYCQHLTDGSIYIGKNVTTISACAFDSSNVSSVVFDKDIKIAQLGSEVFRGTNVTEIELPASIKVIAGLGRASKLETVTFAEGCKPTSIAYEAFVSCTSLTNFVIPSSVTEIADCAFAGCGLTEIEIPFGITELLEQTFSGSKLERVILPATLTLIDCDVFADSYELTEVVFKTYTAADGVDADAIGKCDLESIESCAFAYCENLTKFVFPETTSGDIYVDSSAFDEAAIEEVVLSSSITGDVAGWLAWLPNLNKITVSPDNKNFKVDGTLPILYRADGKTIVYVFGSIGAEYVVPAGSAGVNEKSFYQIGTLKKVYLPDTVKVISSNAFYECNALEEVVFYETKQNAADGTWSAVYQEDGTTLKPATYMQLTTIQSYAFYGCAIKQFTIPASLTTLATGAFQNCKKLQSIVIPESVTDLGNNVFMGCTSLAEATINVKITDGKKSQSLFSGCTSLKKVTIADGTTVITNNMFMKTALESVNIPATVTRIGSKAFENCAQLKNLLIHAALQEIEDFAFRGCAQLEKVTIEENSQLVHVMNGAFSGTSKLEEIDFSNCNQVTWVGYQAFKNSGIKKAVLPNSVINLSDNKDKAVTNLSGEAGAFAACTKLEEVYLPANLQGIGALTFAGCPSLKKIVYNGYQGDSNFALPATVYVIGKGAFSSYNDGRGISAPACAIETADISMVTNSDNLGSQLFKGCLSLKTITVNAAIAKLPVSFAEDCAALKQIDLSYCVNMVEISAYAFKNSALESVTLPATLQTIGAEAFFKTPLTAIELPQSVANIQSKAFAGTAIKSVNASKVYSFGAGAFEDCAQLEEVVLTNALAVIADSLFKNCVSLKEITLPDMVMEIGKYAFANSGLTEITLPSWLFKVGGAVTETLTAATESYAFAGCKDLKTVTVLSQNFVGFGAHAFDGCSALESIALPASTKVIGNGAFANSGLKSVEIGAAVEEIGAGAFENCAALTTFVVAETNAKYGLNADGALIQKETGEVVATPATPAANEGKVEGE